jgi:hypothetical protein
MTELKYLVRTRGKTKSKRSKKWKVKTFSLSTSELNSWYCRPINFAQVFRKNDELCRIRKRKAFWRYNVDGCADWNIFKLIMRIKSWNFKILAFFAVG